VTAKNQKVQTTGSERHRIRKVAKAMTQSELKRPVAALVNAFVVEAGSGPGCLI